ncbi:MAG: hypothetical protein OHM56_04435 [Spiroplasma phoeniceum]|nr:MAG: hypothetical protein OHM57_03835 [Spiroplasma phoeniceum]UZQ33196.1 MAG: hypothetical protein OHM56_04435 [Spiroplasma phoeniceum]
MKKLLSLLSVLTISGSAVPTTIAASPYKKQEQIQKDNLKISKCNNSYIEKFTNIESDIRNIAVDSKKNIYFSMSETNDVNYYVYTLKQGETIANKVLGIQNTYVNSIVVDNNDNIYIATGLTYNFNGSLYLLKQGENFANKILGLNENSITSLVIKNNDIYIGTSSGHIYVLKQGEVIPKQINFKQNFSSDDDVNTMDINKKGDIYFGIYKNGGGNNGVYVLKNGTSEIQKFTQIDRIDVASINVDNDDNMYFGTDYFTYILKNNGEFTKIYRIQGIKNILIDNKNNAYFVDYNHIYLLLKNKIKYLTPTVRKIDTLENISIWNSFINKLNNRIYFATSNGPYTFKK